jgi:hypothetical protein
VKRYVETCEACARAKAPKWKNGDWQSPVIGSPWERVAVDHLGPVKETKRGNRYLLVFTDYFTRYVVAVPVKDCGADSTAQHFVEKIVLQFGAPLELMSDQGAAFVSKVIDSASAMAGTKKLYTTAYRPQANGLVERWNGTVAQMLRTYQDDNKDDWDEKVPYVTFAYNTSEHSAIKMTPHELLFGAKARLPVEVALGTRPTEERTTAEYANDLLVQMQEGYRDAREMNEKMKRARERRLLQDGGHESETFKEDDLVWLERRPRDSKFEKIFDGPYNIVTMHGKNYATIALEDGQEIKVHVERLKKHKLREEAAPITVTNDDKLVDKQRMIEEWVEPDKDKLLSNDLINRRVRVYWSGDRQYYDGTVVNRKKRQHIVQYDDGEVKAERLLGYKPRQAPHWYILERKPSNGDKKVAGEAKRRGSDAASL